MRRRTVRTALLAAALVALVAALAFALLRPDESRVRREREDKP